MHYFVIKKKTKTKEEKVKTKEKQNKILSTSNQLKIHAPTLFLSIYYRVFFGLALFQYVFVFYKNLSCLLIVINISHTICCCIFGEKTTTTTKKKKRRKKFLAKPEKNSTRSQ